jgi:hypothetical protein
MDGRDDFVQTVKARKDLQNDSLTCRASFVSRENVVSLFEQLGVPKEFDLLSLDVDQNTYYLWESLRGFKPRVVIVEYNAAIPPEVDWKVQYGAGRAWDGTQNFGASLKAYEKLGLKLGYYLVGCEFTGTNAFFVREDLATDQFIGPFTAENHFEPPRYGYIRWRGHRRTSILDKS